MKNIIKYTIIFILSIFLGIFSYTKSFAADNFHIATYITGIGCPHCANVAPRLLEDRINECNDMIIVEYEIYQEPANASVIFEFNSNYGSGLGIPQVVFNKDNILVGDSQINKNIDVRCEEANNGVICLPDGNCVKWKDLDLNELPLLPRIWSRDRIAVRTDQKEISEDINILVKDFLTADNPQEYIESLSVNNFVSPEDIEISGGTVKFKTAVSIDGWLLQWNGEDETIIPISDGNTSTQENSDTEKKVSFIKTVTLALSDSVNPCAIAILMMMLVSITTYNPGKKKAVLLSGLSFILAVLVMYFLYGILIVKFFDIIQSFKSVQSVITPALSVIMCIFCLILGILEIKDFVSYKPGSVGTEMPLKLRPKVQKLIAKITSPAGAFVLGLFVTVFLLPCTIGPYFILGGLISTGSTDISAMLPYLLLYNIIFVLPMLAATLIIFFGIKNIEDVKNWKDKNVRIMHLIAGILLTGLAVWVLIENIPAILGLLKVN
jgi:cytochrome c biogenesis protein CcdA